MANRPIRIVGAPGSPYTRKMRALLRYRRIQHHFVQRWSKSEGETPSVPVDLIPVLVFPGEDAAADEAMIDSTWQIRRLESLASDRSVIPPDPALAFIDFLIEDFADEWLTKAMFHYRWSFSRDVENAAAILPLWRGVNVSDEAIAPFSKVIAERQVGRRAVVGINEETGPVIEASFRELLHALDTHLVGSPYLMGERPGTADFGLFGQLTQLALFDPTSVAITREEAPRVYAWCEIVEDLSGLEVADGDWLRRENFPDSLRAILGLVGDYYAPFLLANARAVEAGADLMECNIAGRSWSQQPFAYQARCLGWLRDAYESLSRADRTFVDEQLGKTGCEKLFEG